MSHQVLGTLLPCSIRQTSDGFTLWIMKTWLCRSRPAPWCLLSCIRNKPIYLLLTGRSILSSLSWCSPERSTCRHGAFKHVPLQCCVRGVMQWSLVLTYRLLNPEVGGSVGQAWSGTETSNSSNTTSSARLPIQSRRERSCGRALMLKLVSGTERTVRTEILKGERMRSPGKKLSEGLSQG